MNQCGKVCQWRFHLTSWYHSVQTSANSEKPLIRQELYFLRHVVAGFFMGVSFYCLIFSAWMLQHVSWHFDFSLATLSTWHWLSQKLRFKTLWWAGAWAVRQVQRAGHCFIFNFGICVRISAEPDHWFTIVRAGSKDPWRRHQCGKYSKHQKTSFWSVHLLDGRHENSGGVHRPVRACTQMAVCWETEQVRVTET